MLYNAIILLILLSCSHKDIKTELPEERLVKKEKKVIGWREWVELPELGIKNIKAKVDTGARSSSLHAFDVKIFKRRGKDYVSFTVHPEQRDIKKTITCEEPVLEFRNVRSSNGHVEKRPVIETNVRLLGEEWPIEITLTNRDEMGFRMLLGRQSFRNKFLVDAGKSFNGEKLKKKTAKKKVSKKSTKKATKKKAKSVKRSSTK